MRVLILGSRGFIGANLARELARDFTLCDDSGVDVTVSGSVHATFESARPDIVVLAAGIAGIDRCEREPECAERVNVSGAIHVARECAQAGARLLFLSTAAVFDGTRHGYTEDDPVSPLSVYGRTKAQAESRLAEMLPEAVILRLALVLGRAMRLGTNSLVDKLANSFEQAKTVAAPVEEFRNPIDTRTLAQWIAALVCLPEARGIFHAGSCDSVSRYDLVRQLAKAMGYSEGLAIPQAEPMPGRAPRGRDHFLIPEKLATLCRIPAPGWRQVVERCTHATAESAL
ncbi:MAG: SDR family oxidoreductase [Pseudomonadota bacterium]